MSSSPMRIAIVGGHGKIGLLLTRILADRGDQVTSIIRNPDHTSDVESAGATAKLADVEKLDSAQIADVVAGQQAVVWSAGAGGGSAERTYAVDRDAAIATVDAARACGASRFVMVSYFGAGPDHGVPSDNDFFAYAEAKAAADEYLKGAPGLDWTVLGPSALTNDEGTGTIDAAADEASQVSRANVAAVIAAVLHDPSTVGRTITFNDGETPIADAVAGS
ncbi:MAG: NAD(P)H-binding protein [Ornithinimicrobium sp.]